MVLSTLKYNGGVLLTQVLNAWNGILLTHEINNANLDTVCGCGYFIFKRSLFTQNKSIQTRQSELPNNTVCVIL